MVLFGLHSRYKELARKVKLNLAFEIVWAVETTDWDNARSAVETHRRGSEYDTYLQALDELLPGTIRFADNQASNPPALIPSASIDTEFSIWVRRGYSSAAFGDQTHLVQGYEVVMLDFAWQMAVILDRTRFAEAPSGAQATYSLSVDALIIRFRKEDGMIQIISDSLADLGWQLLVQDAEFFRGVEQFLRSFGMMVDRELPEIISWETFDPLRRFIAPG